MFTGLNLGTSYHWYVRACSAAGCSAWTGPIAKPPDGSDTPTATGDTPATTSGTSVTFYPTANDTDPNTPTSQVISVRTLVPAGTPSLLYTGDIAIVNSTGLGYFAASGSQIGIIDTSSNTITGRIVLTGAPDSPAYSRVNQATKIVYARIDPNLLVAIDGRPTSATFNQPILSLTLGNSISSFVIDEVHGRLYVANASAASSTATDASLSQTQVTAIDIDPGSPTFHSVIGTTVFPNFIGLLRGIAVNTTTNEVWVASNTDVLVLNGATLALVGDIAPTTGAAMLVVNELTNLVYVTGNSGTAGQVYVIDGATRTKIATILVTGSLLTDFERRIAIHQATGRVYVRPNEFPAASRLAIIDGNSLSPQFNTVVAQLPLGREDQRAALLVDQTGNRVLATSGADFTISLVNVLTDSVVATVASSQETLAAALNTNTHTAYVGGAFGVITAVNLSTGTALATLRVGALVVPPTLNLATGRGYTGVTGTSSAIRVFDPSSPIGLVASGSGSYAFGALDALRNRIYISNPNSSIDGTTTGLPGFVSVIDGANDAVIATVAAGNFPTAVAVDESANRIYVGNLSEGPSVAGGLTIMDGATLTTTSANLSAIPLSSGFLVDQLSVGRDVVVNPVTGRVYFRITNGSPSKAAVLNGSTNLATPLNGLGAVNIIRVNPDPALNRIYIGGLFNGQNVVHVLDGADDHEIATLVAGPASVVGGTQVYLEVNRTTGQIFVANYAANSVTVINGHTNSVIGVIPVGNGPNTVAVNEATNHVFVGSWDDGSVTVIDANSLRVIAQVRLPLRPGPNCPLNCGQLRLTADPVNDVVYASWTGEAGSETGLMTLSDPVSPFSPLSITSVTQGANGVVVLNADGSVAYTPNVGFSGTDIFNYSVADSVGGVSSGTVTVTVRSVPIITTAVLPTVVIGQSYNQTLSASGGTSPYVWSVVSGQLPAGLSLNGATGTIAGTASLRGTFTVTLQVRDSFNNAGTRALTMVVGPPVISTASLPTATINSQYTQTMVAGGTVGAVTWTLNTNNSPLLTWLSLSSAGVLSGTPPAYGTTPPFTVTVTDALNQIASSASRIGVGGPLEIVSTTLREGVVLETQPALPIVGGNGAKR